MSTKIIKPESNGSPVEPSSVSVIQSGETMDVKVEDFFYLMSLAMAPFEKKTSELSRWMSSMVKESSAYFTSTGDLKVSNVPSHSYNLRKRRSVSSDAAASRAGARVRRSESSSSSSSSSSFSYFPSPKS